MNLSEKDKHYVWHPFTQEKTAPEPLLISSARGSYLKTEDGREILDAVSSWWVTLHGHCHPRISRAVSRQIEILDQVIFAGMTHEPAVLLAERILALLGMGNGKVFFSDNGSTAVEVALKIALQFWANQGKKRNRIIAFRHGYHGDTFGAMSVSHRSAFTSPFADKMFEVLFIDPPLKGEDACYGLRQLEELLHRYDDIAALIYEPMVQGAGGMLMQDAQLLSEYLRMARDHGILCIADEVMTGFGRTGRMFASFWTDIMPDIVCLAKGLTGGTLPLSATLCRESVYREFFSEDPLLAFYHGHSFTANPVACAAAHASLDLLNEADCILRQEEILAAHQGFCEYLKHEDVGSVFSDVRQQGNILAFELRTDENTGYFNGARKRIQSFFIRKQILIRPLGNVLYLIPPYSTTSEDLQKAYDAITEFAREIMQHDF